MNFDYEQTQSELTYRMSSALGWELKKVAIPGISDISAGLENEAFQSQMEQMTRLGWALVSIVAVHGFVKQSLISGKPYHQTSNYNLFWKRPKQLPFAAI